MTDPRWLLLCVKRHMTEAEVIEAKLSNDKTRYVEQVLHSWVFSKENHVTAREAQQWCARVGAEAYVKLSVIGPGVQAMNRKQRRAILRAKGLL